MTDVTSLEVSKELYEISGWAETHRCYRLMTSGNDKDWRCIDILPNIAGDVPAYDLGYLLRKLPKRLLSYLSMWLNVGPFDEKLWGACYMNSNDVMFNTWDDTPEDATAKLAIELFKQGVLTRGGDE